MKPILLALCFLLVFCHGHPRHGIARSCDKIKAAYEDFSYSWQSGYGTDVDRDKFVTQYPVAQQRRVLKCIAEGKK